MELGCEYMPIHFPIGVTLEDFVDAQLRGSLG